MSGKVKKRFFQIFGGNPVIYPYLILMCWTSLVGISIALMYAYLILMCWTSLIGISIAFMYPYLILMSTLASSASLLPSCILPHINVHISPISISIALMYPYLILMGWNSLISISLALMYPYLVLMSHTGLKHISNQVTKCLCKLRMLFHRRLEVTDSDVL